MKKVLNWLYIIFGTACTALALSLCLVPRNMEPGGISGVAVIIHKLIGGTLPVGLFIAVLNLPLFILAFMKLGRSFALKSLVGMLLYSGFSAFFEYLFTVWRPPFIEILAENDLILVAVYGGVIYGFGLGLVFKGGASTGGTDIIAKLMLRKSSVLSLGQIMYAFDVLLLIVFAIINKRVEPALYSGIALFLGTKVIDLVEGGVNYAKEAKIILPVDEDTADLVKAVDEKLHKSVTKTEGTGMHYGREVQILMVIVGNRQLSRLREIVHNMHPKAFVIVSDVREIEGYWRRS